MEDEEAVGRALHRAGLTSYPHATAEILRFMRHLEDEGYGVERLEDPITAPDHGPGGYVIPASFMDPESLTGIDVWDEVVRPLLRRTP